MARGAGVGLQRLRRVPRRHGGHRACGGAERARVNYSTEAAKQFHWRRRCSRAGRGAEGELGAGHSGPEQQPHRERGSPRASRGTEGQLGADQPGPAPQLHRGRRRPRARRDAEVEHCAEGAAAVEQLDRGRGRPCPPFRGRTQSFPDQSRPEVSWRNPPPCLCYGQPSLLYPARTNQGYPQRSGKEGKGTAEAEGTRGRAPRRRGASAGGRATTGGRAFAGGGAFAGVGAATGRRGRAAEDHRSRTAGHAATTAGSRRGGSPPEAAAARERSPGSAGPGARGRARTTPGRGQIAGAGSRAQNRRGTGDGQAGARGQRVRPRYRAAIPDGAFPSRRQATKLQEQLRNRRQAPRAGALSRPGRLRHGDRRDVPEVYQGRDQDDPRLEPQGQAARKCHRGARAGDGAVVPAAVPRERFAPHGMVPRAPLPRHAFHGRWHRHGLPRQAAAKGIRATRGAPPPLSGRARDEPPPFEADADPASGPQGRQHPRGRERRRQGLRLRHVQDTDDRGAAVHGPRWGNAELYGARNVLRPGETGYSHGRVRLRNDHVGAPFRGRHPPLGRDPGRGDVDSRPAAN